MSQLSRQSLRAGSEAQAEVPTAGVPRLGAILGEDNSVAVSSS